MAKNVRASRVSGEMFRPVVRRSRKFQPREEQLLREGIQFDVEPVQSRQLPLLLGAHVRLARVRLRVLDEVGGEAQVEGVLEEVARLRLMLGQAKEGDTAEVVLGAVEHHLVPRGAVWNNALVVASYEAEICEHTGLTIVRQVVLTVHELIEAYAGPVGTFKSQDRYMETQTHR